MVTLFQPQHVQPKMIQPMASEQMNLLLLPPWADSGEDCHYPPFASVTHFAVLTPQPPRF